VGPGAFALGCTPGPTGAGSRTLRRAGERRAARRLVLPVPGERPSQRSVRNTLGAALVAAGDARDFDVPFVKLARWAAAIDDLTCAERVRLLDATDGPARSTHRSPHRGRDGVGPAEAAERHRIEHIQRRTGTFQVSQGRSRQYPFVAIRRAGEVDVACVIRCYQKRGTMLKARQAVTLTENRDDSLRIRAPGVRSWRGSR
jgi:hypothetical protein